MSSVLPAAILAGLRSRADEPAVVTPDGVLTCSRLLDEAVAIARGLTVDGARAPVAVVGHGDAESILLVIAVLLSGRPLVCLDPLLPALRHAAILERVGVAAITTVVEARNGAIAAGQVRSVSDGGSIAVAEDDIAVVGFTSGSTGVPKGVRLSHRASIAKARDLTNELSLTGDDRLGTALPITFGAGINALIAGLIGGSTVLCWDPRTNDVSGLAAWLERESATTLHCSIALLRAVTAPSSITPSSTTPSSERVPLRMIVVYGEPCHSDDVRRVRESAFADAAVVNWYATTECGVVASFVVAPGEPLEPGFLPAGRTPVGRTVDIVDENGSVLERGQIGQVRLRGAELASGYVGETSLRFGMDSAGRSVYLTGDLGRIDDRGLLRLAGRMDDAVKIHGYLVEPMEIQTALRGVDGIVDAAVVPHDHDLAAYVVLRSSGAAAPTVDDIRGALRTSLPEWMVPRYVSVLDSLPRTERGKLDRSVLPVPRDDTASASTSAATTLTQLAVFEAARSILERPRIGLDDDLIALGADSLALTRILGLVRQRFHVEVDPAWLARTPTLRTLADLVDERTQAGVRDRRANPVLIPLRASGTKNPLFVVPGGGAPAVSLTPLARELDDDRPVYALQAWGLENRGVPDRTLVAAARRYVREIRAVVPHGPYLLAGHSLGGIVALEMASQLADVGERTELVTVIDSRLTDQLMAHLPASTEGDVEESSDITVSADSTYEPLTLAPLALVRLFLQMKAAGILQFTPVVQWTIFYNVGLRQLRRHRPRRWDGPVLVLRTEENGQGRRTWSRLATGALTFDSVPGTHTELLRPPHVVDVARRIDAHLAGSAG